MARSSCSIRNCMVDSARWGSGEPANVFKAKDSPDVWVRAPRRLETGDSLALTLSYPPSRRPDRPRTVTGSSSTPEPPGIRGTGRARTSRTSTSRITRPSWYPLASVGERIDSTVSGQGPHHALDHPATDAVRHLQPRPVRELPHAAAGRAAARRAHLRERASRARRSCWREGSLHSRNTCVRTCRRTWRTA